MLWSTASFTTVLALAITTTNAQESPLNWAPSPPSYPSPWMKGGDGWDEAYEKAKLFVSGLSLTEKVNLTTGVGWSGEQCVGNTGSIPRLDFRGLCLQDGPLGIRFTDFATLWPSGMNVGATWSRRLFKERGYGMGIEHKGKGVDVQLAPVAGPLGRTPLGGRNWEGFASDPVLTGIAMAESIKGIQEAGVIATAKHFIGNEQEHNRDLTDNGNTPAYSANIDDKTMHELYLWPFADAVRAGVGSVMSSYNQINNSYAAQNSYLINYILKNELDFQGFVMSDWWAQHTGVAAVFSGTDMSMAGDRLFASGDTWWGGHLTEAVLNGTVPQWRLDDMATRIMSAYFKVGVDKARVPINFSSWTNETFGYRHDQAKEYFEQVNWHVDVQGDHKELAREIAGASTVLLKNVNGALPLNAPKKVAVIGEDAHDNPAGPNSFADRGGNSGTLAQGWGSGAANYPYLIAPVTALRAQAGETKSSFTNVSDNYNFDAVTQAVAGADVAIVFANSNGGEGYITVDGNMGDRNNLTLWGNGDALIAHVASQNPNTIVVLHTVGPVLIEDMKNNPNITAIVWAGLPGQESGNAITDILYGARNPSAKTVFTWGKKREDWAVDVIYVPTNIPNQMNYDEGIMHDYRHFDQLNIEPSYEFGFGLSYTNFTYSNLQIVKNETAPYTATTGITKAAETFGTVDMNETTSQFPEGFKKIKGYVYPFLTGPVPRNNTSSWPDKFADASPQPLIAAGGAAGGNAQLWDVMYTVTATVQNVGDVAGTEVSQLYLSLGGPTDPKLVLRGFNDIALEVGEEKTFTVEITRRDLSNWDTTTQNWFISEFEKSVHVGGSSRCLPLSGTLASPTA